MSHLASASAERDVLKDIQQHLGSHPDVREVGVRLNDQMTGARFEVQVTANCEANSHIVNRWNKLYEVSYATGPCQPEFSGWNSSYTRKPIPEPEMHEWLDTTVRRIRALNPTRIVEIGCGMGLILQHLAPECEFYIGTDFSNSALSRLSEWICSRANLSNVRLLHRAADDLGELAAGSCDVVVINSVAQYFPDVTYLLSVLEQAVRLVGSRGYIFVGDIRNLHLLQQFQAAVQLTRAADETPVSTLRDEILRAVEREAELLIAPEFFTAVAERVAGVTSAEIQLRRGCAHNELTRYRYDAVLRVGGAKLTAVSPRVTSWSQREEVWSQLSNLGQTSGEHPSRLERVPNRRLTRDVNAEELIARSEATERAADLREQLRDLPDSGVDPESVWQWGEAHGSIPVITWSSPAHSDCFDVLFHPGKSTEPLLPWDEYANDPAFGVFERRLLATLDDYLCQRFPCVKGQVAWTITRRPPT